MKPMPAKPISIIAQVDGSGTDDTGDHSPRKFSSFIAPVMTLFTKSPFVETTKSPKGPMPFDPPLPNVLINSQNVFDGVVEFWTIQEVMLPLVKIKKFAMSELGVVTGVQPALGGKQAGVDGIVKLPDVS